MIKGERKLGRGAGRGPKPGPKVKRGANRKVATETVLRGWPCEDLHEVGAARPVNRVADAQLRVDRVEDVLPMTRRMHPAVSACAALDCPIATFSPYAVQRYFAAASRSSECG